MASEPFDKELDIRGEKCPMPIIKARKQIQQMGVGEVLKVVSTDPGSVLDFQGWAKAARNIDLVHQSGGKDSSGEELFIHLIRRSA